MPLRIPVLESEVRPGALPTVYRSGANPIGQVGNAIAGVAQQAVREIGGAVRANQERADGLRITDETDSLNREIELLVQDPAAGALTKQGPAALEAVDATLEKYDTSVGKRLEGLANTRQREVFQQLANRRRAEIANQLNAHARAEMRRYDADRSAALIQSTTKRAARAWNNPDVVDQAYREIVDFTAAEVQRTAGGDQAVLEQALNQRVSAFHLEVLAAMPESASKAAEAYYAEHKAEIDPAQHNRIEDFLERANVGQWAQDQADQVWKATGGRYGDAIAAAEQEPDEKRRKALLSQIDAKYQRQRVVQGEEAESRWNTALGEYQAGGNQLSAVSARTLSAMKPEERAKLEDLAGRDRRERESAAGTTFQDRQEMLAYAEAMDVATTNPERFMAAGFLEDRIGRLRGTKFEQLVKLRADMREGKGQGKDAKALALLKPEQLLTKYASDAGIVPRGVRPNKWSDEQANRYDALQDLFQSYLTTFEAQNRKKPTDAEMREFLERATTTVRLRDWWGDTTKTLFELDDTDEGTRYVPVERIPEDERSDLREFLRRGLPTVDDDNIENFYYRTLVTQPGEDAEVDAYREARAAKQAATRAATPAPAALRPISPRAAAAPPATTPGAAPAALPALDIPPDARNRIAERLKQRGIPATEDNIRAAYRKVTGA